MVCFWHVFLQYNSAVARFFACFCKKVIAFTSQKLPLYSVKAIILRCKSYQITNEGAYPERAMLCIVLYYRALVRDCIFADFRSKISFRDFEGQNSQVKYETKGLTVSHLFSYLASHCSGLSFARSLRNWNCRMLSAPTVPKP